MTDLERANSGNQFPSGFLPKHKQELFTQGVPGEKYPGQSVSMVTARRSLIRCIKKVDVPEQDNSNELFFEQTISNAFLDCQQLNLMQGEIRLAELHYSFDVSRQSYEIAFVETPHQHRRRGYGIRLLHEFVNIAGKDRSITGSIVHTETWEKLEDLGILQETVEKQKVLIQESERLSLLPIVRFLESGGITVSRIITEFDDAIIAEYSGFIRTGNPQVDYQKVMELIRSGRDDYLSMFRADLEGRT